MYEAESGKPTLLDCTDCTNGAEKYGYLLKESNTCADITMCIFGGAGGTSGAGGSSGMGGSSGAGGSGGSSGNSVTIVWVPPTTYAPQNGSGAPSFVMEKAPEVVQAGNVLAVMAMTGSFYTANIEIPSGTTAEELNVKFYSVSCSGTGTQVMPGWHGDFGPGLCGGSRGQTGVVNDMFMGMVYAYDDATSLPVMHYENGQDAGSPYGIYTMAFKVTAP